MRRVRSDPESRHDIEVHLRPQTLTRIPGWESWAGTIKDFEVAINGLRNLNYNLHTVNVTKSHGRKLQSWQPTQAGLAKLCTLAQPEYKDLGMNPATGPCGLLGMLQL